MIVRFLSGNDYLQDSMDDESNWLSSAVQWYADYHNRCRVLEQKKESRRKDPVNGSVITRQYSSTPDVIEAMLCSVYFRERASINLSTLTT